MQSLNNYLLKDKNNSIRDVLIPEVNEEQIKSIGKEFKENIIDAIDNVLGSHLLGQQKYNSLEF